MSKANAISEFRRLAGLGPGNLPGGVTRRTIEIREEFRGDAEAVELEAKGPSAYVEWDSIVPVEQAVSLLGYKNLAALRADFSGLSHGFARGRAQGAWDANEREAYVAWRSIAAHLG